MCRAASRAIGPPMTSKQLSAPTPAQGIDHYFVTDDNFASNSNWEVIFSTA